MATQKIVIKTDTFENQRVKINEIGQDTYNILTGGVTIENLSVDGYITESTDGGTTYWNVVTQQDVGTAANQVPLNQYLGQLAFLDDFSPNGLRREGGSSDDVVVNAIGNVGIGTDAPTRKLTVSGSGTALLASIERTDSASVYLNLSGNTTTSNSYVGIGANANNLVLRAGNSDHVRVTSSGKVGIGTNNPDYKLAISSAGNDYVSVSNTINVTSGLFGVNSQGVVIASRDTPTGSTDKPIQFVTGTTERARIDSSGNVLIGGTTAATADIALNADGSAEFAGNVTTSSLYAPNQSRVIEVNNGQSSSARVAVGLEISSSGTGSFSSGLYTSVGGSSKFRLLSGSSVSADLYTQNVKRLNIDANGNVGIGGTLPSAPNILLNANGSITAAGNLTIGDKIIHNGDTNTAIRFPANDTVSVETAGSERLRITSTGLVGIGTSSPDDVLDVRSGAAGFSQFVHTSGQGGVRISGTGASSSANLVFSNNHTSGVSDEFTIQMDGATDDLLFISGGTGGSETMRITSAGLVGIGTSAPTQSLTIANTATAQIHLHSAFPAIRLSSDTGGSDNAKRAFFGLSTSSNGFITGSVLNDLCISGTSGGKVLFGVGNSTKMAITSTGNVGIGTTAPDRLLTVSNTSGNGQLARFIGPTNSLFIDNDRSGVIDIFSSGTGDSLSFGTQSTERARIDSSGNVGIGTSSPTAALDIGSSLYQAVRTVLPSITDTYHQYRGTPDGSGYEHARVFSGRDAAVHNYGSYLGFYTEGKSSGTTDTSVERLRIDSSGRVGIGTTSPDGLLTVRPSSGNSQIFVRTNDTTSRSQLLFGDSADNNVGGVQYDHSDNSMQFHLANTGEKVRIDSSGRVGIGTSSPGEKLHVNGGNQNIILSGSYAANQSNKIEINNGQSGAARNAVGLELSSSGSGGYTSAVYASSGSNTRYSFIKSSPTTTTLLTANQSRLFISTSGNVGIGTTTPTEILDVVGNIKTSGSLYGPANFIIDPAAVGDDTGKVIIKGDLQIDGTTTTVNSTTMTVDDKNIELGTGAANDAAADGGGITLKGATDKTLTWVNSTDCWTFNQALNLTAGTAAAPALVFNGDVNTGLYSPGADQVAISTNGTGRLFVDASGRVGLGVSPESLVHISSAAPGVRLSETDQAVDKKNWDIFIASGSATFRALNDSGSTASRSIQVSRGATFDITSIMFFTGLDQERLRIDYAGRVGIGTSSPIHKLHADGQIFAGSNYSGVQYGGIRIAPYNDNVGGQAGGVIYGGQSTDINSAMFFRRGYDGALNTIDINSYGNIRFFTNGSIASQTEKLRITSTGEIKANGSFQESTDGGTTYWNVVTQQDVGTAANQVPLNQYLGQLAFLDDFSPNGLRRSGGSSDDVVVNAIGNVGIGTASPNSRLHVESGKIEISRFSGSYTGNTVNSQTSLITHPGSSAASGSGSAISIIGGTASATSIFFGDTADADIGSISYLHPTNHMAFTVNVNERLRITSDGNVGIGTDTPAEKLEVYGNGRFKAADGSHGIELYPDVGGLGYQRIISYNRTSSAYENLSIGANDFIVTSGDTSESLRITSTGHTLPGADATQDLGSATKRWANIYSADLQLSNEGSSNDVDGTWGQYTIQEGEDDLFLINRRSGKKYKFNLTEV